MSDPIINQVREAYAAKFDCDLDRIFADLQQRQRASGRNYVTLDDRGNTPQKVDPPLPSGNE